MAAVHEGVFRDVRYSTLSDIFTFQAIEPRVAGTGVIPNGLDALPLFAAGCVLAGSCIAQRPLFISAAIIIPLSGRSRPLDVHLHTVFIVLLIVGLIVCPVLSLLGERLFGSHPSPLIIDLSDPNPIVRAVVGYDIIEVSNFIFILDGH